MTDFRTHYPKDSDAVYYRPILTESGKVHVCHMQWFDEFDYDQSKFLTEENFSTEEQARQWVRDNPQVRAGLLADRDLFED